MAAATVFGAGSRIEGSEGAVAEIGTQPFGAALLAVVAVGLMAYVAWRMVQAFLDPDRVGADAKGVLTRVGYFLSGLGYVGLALAAGRGALGGRTDDGSERVEWTAWLLEFPAGPVLVGGIGLVVIGVAVGQLAAAWMAGFMDKYDRAEMSPAELRWAERIGRFGFAARGVTFGIIGGFLVSAGVNHDAREARGLGGALQALAAQAYGPWLLGVVALGLFAYGLFCLTCARWRAIHRLHPASA
ncbi:MAG: DUF1206 domain-containing protein [Deltaproteobacteria bacterium]|nr:DUF1206 domain-containing protein [Deltaproteobacteria bacterium]